VLFRSYRKHPKSHQFKRCPLKLLILLYNCL